MARIEWVDHRLQNWALYKRGGVSGGLGYAGVSLDVEGGRTGYREAVIPIDSADAVVTERGVAALEPDLRVTVEVYYLQPGPDVTVAQDLGIARSTLHARIDAAHRQLALWFIDRGRAASQERRRVERLIDASRP